MLFSCLTFQPAEGIIIPDDPPLGCECAEGACDLVRSLHQLFACYTVKRQKPNVRFGNPNVFVFGSIFYVQLFLALSYTVLWLYNFGHGDVCHGDVGHATLVTETFVTR